MGLFTIGYFLSLIITSGLLKIEKVKRVITVIVCLAVCLVGSVCLTINDNKSPKAYVIGTETDCATVIDYKEQTVMIGDRIYTDIASGYNAGVDTIFVLSGEGTLEDAKNSETPPTYIYKSIKEVYNDIK